MSSDARVTLEQRLQNGPLMVDEAVRVVWGLCDRFEKQGKTETLGDVTPARVTLHGRVVEAVVPPNAAPVPGASAPERAHTRPTPRSDVYAMGALLYRLITGHVPDGQPLPAAASHLQAVLERSLAADPGARFANLAELKRALVRLDKTLMSGPKSATNLAVTRTSLGPWNLEGLLGEGSMGHVFKATHQALGRRAAIKLLRPEQYQNPELINRFFQEARTVNQINHEHIVEISDFVQEAGEAGPSAVYCVMEFLQGRTLGEVIDDAPLPLARALPIVEQLCDALAAAHRVGVVHRDVKPDNIMLIERGGQRDYVKVLDFGVAKLTATDGKAMVSTTEGAIIGTPICMSPEQSRGDDVDARSDIWAVGIILYRLLAGVFPFDAANFVNIAVQIITRPVDPLPARTALGEAIPARLVALVNQCLRKQRELRPATMGLVRDELRAIIRNEPDAATAKRSRLGLLAAVGVVVLVGGGAAVWRLTQPPVVEPVKPLPALVTPPVVQDPVAPDDAGPGGEVMDASVEVPVDAGAPSVVAVEVDAGAPTVVVAEVDAGVKPLKVKRVPLTPALVQKAFSAARSDVAKCLNDNQASLPRDGKVVVSVTIPTSGLLVVRTLTLAGAPLPKRAEQCVREVLKRKVKFPLLTEQRDGAYEYPYQLK